MERNLKQLLADHPWLLDLLHDIAGEASTFHEFTGRPDLERFVQEYIRDNTPIPKVSELIQSKEFYAQRVQSIKPIALLEATNVMSIEDVEDIFKMLQLGHAINDIAVDLSKPSPKSSITETFGQKSEVEEEDDNNKPSFKAPKKRPHQSTSTQEVMEETLEALPLETKAEHWARLQSDGIFPGAIKFEKMYRQRADESDEDYEHRMENAAGDKHIKSGFSNR